MDPKVEYFAFTITEENWHDIAKEFDPKDVMPAVYMQSPETFEPGCYAVVRLISMDDPFSDSLGNRLHSVWIATAEQFNAKFVVDGTNEIYSHRLEIHPK